MGKIEFIKGEKKCRWNGVLMNEDNFKKLFGIDEDDSPVIEDNIIESGNTIYTDMSFGELFRYIVSTRGEHRGKEPEYDEILSKGYGFHSHCERESVECSYIIREDVVEYMSGTVVKPYGDFYKEHPDFNEKMFLEFEDDLDAYYENREYLNEQER